MQTQARREVAPATATSLPELLAARSAASPDRVAWRQKQLGLWSEHRWAQLEARAAAYAAGFARRGVEPGSHVAMIVGPGFEAAAAGLGLLGLGAVVVSLHPGPAAPGLGPLLADADVQVAIAEDAEQIATILECRAPDTAGWDLLVVDPRGMALTDEAPARLESVAERGGTEADAIGSWRDSVGRLDPEAPALVALSVGGSGAPRPVTLTHRNLVTAAHALADGASIVTDDEILSYLPPSHVLERVLSTGVAPLVGAVVNAGTGPAGVLTDLREVHPTVLLGVPGLWARLTEVVEDQRARTSRLKRKVLDAGLRRGRRDLPARRGGARPGWFAGRLSTRRVRAQLGLERMRVALGALASLSDDTADALGAIGVVVRQVYGTVEASGLLTLEPADSVRPGSVGRPVEATEVRVDADGELLARGAQVASGAVDGDGWLHTGDRAHVDDDLLVRLAGRVDDRIVMASGARVDASMVARVLEHGPLVHRAIVTGDRRTSIGALLELDPIALGDWASGRSAPASRKRDPLEWPELRQELDREVATANEALPADARVQEIRVLPDPLGLEAELTATRRLRRATAIRLHASLVEDMYGE